MKTLIFYLTLTVSTIAQDLPIPKDPPASTLNSNPPTLYSEWVTFGKYYFKKSQGQAVAITQQTATIADLTARLASNPTLTQIATDVASIKASIAGLGGTKVTMTAASSALTIAWDAVPNATGYRVERSTDGTNFSQIGGDILALSYVDKNLPPASYWYRVRAYNATAVSLYSNVASYAFAR